MVKRNEWGSKDYEEQKNWLNNKTINQIDHHKLDACTIRINHKIVEKGS